MFFFNTIVACIINRTLRKHNTNEVKDSVIFLQTNITLYNVCAVPWGVFSTVGGYHEYRGGIS